MLAVLTHNVPAARPYWSDSTVIPVEDGSLDAVLVADAWHWFEPEETIAALRRVLRPGGRLGLVYERQRGAGGPLGDRTGRGVGSIFYWVCSPKVQVLVRVVQRQDRFCRAGGSAFP
ncbi:hypothetical protein GCM10011575_38550 [Microlunatus endophyticus]|uniref:Methyltransferase type 11 domain-containing protein n=2 Tax=Microlunatus endophyticus TaxID=1716077 RepID=A0A917SGY3_9ACTN|nr:hypothetical protein GCM10011575_38550 [Microlunatus endophyticus]